MADKPEVLQEVVVTRPDGYQYTVQVNDRDRRMLEDQGMTVGKVQEVGGIKKMPAPKNKARRTGGDK